VSDSDSTGTTENPSPPDPRPEGAAGTATLAPEDTPGSALSDAATVEVAPEVLANSLGEYFAAWGRRIRNGESGVLPVIAGLIIIVIFFQLERSTFLTAGNLVNLLDQAAIFVVFGVAEIFVLLLSEIDLSIGFNAAIGAFVIAELIAPPVNLPWWLGIICGLAATSFIGFVQGSLITRLGLPSFVVTLGGYIGLQGVMLEIANADSSAVGGVINIDPNGPVGQLAIGNMSITLGWIILVVVVALFAVVSLARSRQRRAQGLTTPPLGVTLLGVGLVAVGGILLILICSVNRGLALSTITGIPYEIPVVLVLLVLLSWFMSRTRVGRYIYAIGANPEAARRAGIKVKRIQTLGFVLAGLLAGVAGLIYASTLGNMSTDFPGGQYVLYAVAAAVVGGTSLFGGRGKIVHALLGGIVIAAVFNGLGLMGVSSAVQLMATAVVLIAAVTLDALVRRRAVAR
jgi:D-xylose transport system permease protein